MDNVIEESLTQEQMEAMMADFTAAVDEHLESNSPVPEPPAQPITMTLPPNSPTILMKEDTIRFSSAEWYNKMQTLDITLAGLGGIGSYLGFLVGRMKPQNIFAYDDDVVDATNLSGQLYRSRDVGQLKSSALSNVLYEFASYYSTTSLGRLDSHSVISPILLCGFDNMIARKIAYRLWKSNLNIATREERKNHLFIDGRLAAEELQVFCMTGTDKHLIDKYEKEWLFDDSEAEETICSYKQTSFCANMIGSIMVNLLVNFVTNLCNPLMERPLPFMTSYDATTMMFKTE